MVKLCIRAVFILDLIILLKTTDLNKNMQKQLKNL